MKTRALIFPVGPEFVDLPIDGYELALTSGETMKSIQLVNGKLFGINNVCDCVLVFVIVILLTLYAKTKIFH